MGVLDGKAAIVTGSARGIGRATAELLAENGARVLINDLDADVAEQAAAEIARRDRRLRRRPHQGGRARPARAEGRRRVRPARHHRQQRGLHLGRRGPQDDRRAVPGHARHPHGRPLPRDPRGRPAPARAGQEGARGGRGGLSQDRERQLGLRHDGQRRAGELLGRQGRRGRPDQDAGQGVGPVQGQRERGGVRLRRDPPDRLQGGGRQDRGRGPRGRAGHPRADARDGEDDDPGRPRRLARGGRRPGLLPLLPAGRTTCTARC